MQWVRRNLKFIIPGGVVIVAVAAWLAFGVFGVQFLFIDDEVDEAGPVFDSGADASAQGAAATEDVVDESLDSADGEDAAVVGTDEEKVDKQGPGGEVQASLDAVAEAEAEAAEAEAAADAAVDEQAAADAAAAEAAAEQEAAAQAEPQIVTLVEGSFIPRGRYSGEGRAFVLNDGSEQRFLRFEEFSTDNGPDLNVYLVNSDANADEGTFDDDFIDLGNLKGNIGDQNYEIPPDVDLEVYDTVVVWCVRFSSAFTAADLLPV